MDRLFASLRRRSLIIFFSDLLDMDGSPQVSPHPSEARSDGAAAKRQKSANERATSGMIANSRFAKGLAQLRAKGHDVVLMHTLHPDEIDLPFTETTRFVPMEPGDPRSIVADPGQLRTAFKAASAAFRTSWRKACLESGVDYLFANASTPPAQIIRKFLAARGQA